MNGSTPIDDQLLAKYIAGEADATERSAVEQWAAASDANALELERMRSVWNWSGDGSGAIEADVDAAWDRVNARIEGEGSVGRVIPMRTWNLRRWAVAAAVVVGVVLAARLLMRTEQVYLAEAAYLPVKLADSSAVVLSPGSRIAAVMGGTRTVELKGEAYFEVHRDTEHPFVISAEDLEVTVLGTAFTVSAYDSSGALTVRVREGRVQVVANADTLILTAGQHARFDRERHFLERVIAPPAEIWGEKIIQFEEAPLPTVVAQLQTIFRVHIELGNPAMARCKLTATFEEEPIERILDVIAQTYGFTVTPAGDTYTLQGDGCE